MCPPTVRLIHLGLEHAEFVCRLLNTADYIASVGDRGVRSVAQAKEYIERYFLASQKKHGFGYFVVEVNDSLNTENSFLNKTKTLNSQLAGMVGLMQRSFLNCPDIGFAILPDFYGQGVAYKASKELMNKARNEYGLSQLQAFTNPSNQASQRLLLRLGFEFSTKFLGPESKSLLAFEYKYS